MLKVQFGRNKSGNDRWNQSVSRICKKNCIGIVGVLYDVLKNYGQHRLEIECAWRDFKRVPIEGACVISFAIAVGY